MGRGAGKKPVAHAAGGSKQTHKFSYTWPALLVILAAVAVAFFLQAAGEQTSKNKDRSSPATPGVQAKDDSVPKHSSQQSDAPFWRAASAAFEALEGYIPDGSSLDAFPNGTMTLKRAFETCKATPDCAGFTTDTAHVENKARELADRADFAGLDRLLGVRFFFFKKISMGRVTGLKWISFVDRNWVAPGANLTLQSGDYTDIDVKHALNLVATSYNANFIAARSAKIAAGEQVPELEGRPDLFGAFNVTVLHHDPMILMVDNFFKPAEIEHMVTVSEVYGFAPSAVVDEASTVNRNAKKEGLFTERYTSYRTSWTAHCSNEACAHDPIIAAVQQRIADLTSTKPNNAESLQFTRYDVGQEFKPHSDMIPAHGHSPCGHRIFTVFGYLLQPESGGATAFPELGLMVEPIPGRVVVWPNALDEATNRDDPRTHHAGMPVLAGRKMGVNAWIHRGDYKLAAAAGLG